MKTLTLNLILIAPSLHVWMLVRLVMAVLLGSLVGYERERQGKPAGLRTHAMVALGAALFTLVSIYGFGESADTSRVAAMIVSGIGFLGAGAILHERGGVQGLTTAASLWVTAAIGIAVGVGMVLMSLATAALVFAVLRFAPTIRPNAPQDMSGIGGSCAMNSKPTTDPVCGMKLGEGAAKEFLLYEGREYYFCSVGCRAEFERHMEDYAERAQSKTE